MKNPFLNNYKNDNYDMIVAYDPKFKTNIDSLGKRLSINKMEILSNPPWECHCPAVTTDSAS